MNRRSVLFLTSLFLTLVLTTPGHALFDNAVDKAEDFLKAKMVPQAIEVLEKEINEDPTNAEAHFLLGQCYLKEGRFQHAEERFESAAALQSKYKQQVGEAFYDACLQYKQAGDTRMAVAAFNKASTYKPSLKAKGYDFFLDLSQKVSGSEKESYLDQALLYAKNQDQRKKVAKEYLYLAVPSWPGSRADALKTKAASIVGDEAVSKIFPEPYTTKVIFEKTYTDKDAAKDGNIYTFTWGPEFKVDDLIEIIGKIPGKSSFNAEEIKIWRGKKFTPKWQPTQNGYYSTRFQTIPKSGRGVIWLKPGENIHATVKVTGKRVSDIFRKVVFEKTYTDADADEKGWIKAIAWGKDDVKIGDSVQVIGSASKQDAFGRKILFRHDGNEWIPLLDGRYSFDVTRFTENTFFYLGMEKNEGVKATVRVTRKTQPKPKAELISGL